MTVTCGDAPDPVLVQPGARRSGIGLEVVSDYRGDTFRAVYTVRLANRVLVLHAFQKKSKHGIATPQADVELIRRRLRRAVEISDAKG
jgi:phage-related protein